MTEPQNPDGPAGKDKAVGSGDRSQSDAPASKPPASQPDEADNKAKAQDARDEGPKRKPPGKKPLFIIAAVVVILAIGALFYWLGHRNEATTDDAYTDGNVVTIAPKVSGYVVDLRINDNVFVHKGDLLLKIDPRDAQAAVEQAQAALELARAQLESARSQLAVAEVQFPAQLAQARAQEASAKANLMQADATHARQHGVDVRATTLENIDAADAQQTSARANVANAQAQVKVAKEVPEQLRQVRAAVAERMAQVDQSQAQLDSANLTLSYCELRAPADGWVTRRNVQLGSFVQAGTALFALVTTEIWVTANFKESQLDRMRVGNAVRIEVDAYPSLRLSGHVDSIQLGSGSRFSAFPAENATGNFVKIVQRVPVKIVIDHGIDPKVPIPLGISVTPIVNLP
ncbi:MAG: HlyD family secretion protein [Burkholderiaceae bacterium]|jgi:membrane fusion protein (multidrug efflux system)